MKSLGNKSANSKNAHTCNCILLTLSYWLSSEMQTLSFKLKKIKGCGLKIGKWFFVKIINFAILRVSIKNIVKFMYSVHHFPAMLRTVKQSLKKWQNVMWYNVIMWIHPNRWIQTMIQSNSCWCCIRTFHLSGLSFALLQNKIM